MIVRNSFANLLKLAISKNVQHRTTLATTAYTNNLLTNPSTAITDNDFAGKRYTSFMTQVRASEIWSGATGVSNAGKKKGRGKRVGRKKITDLNRGQIMGTGRNNMKWPGLNSPILVGNKVLPQTQLPPDPEQQQSLVRMRDMNSRISYIRLAPLERGFSGPFMAGRSVGPPQPINDYVFTGFDSKVLEQKVVTNMTGNLGRKRRISIFVVTGNKHGVAGYGLGKASTQQAALRMALNKAGQKLMYIRMFEDHTVYHNMWSQYQRSKIFLHKKQQGYGLRCHRVIKAICEMIGIKDLHCKVENSTSNVQSITKAFFNALTNQESHQECADRMGYHLVEMRKEKLYCPRVIASPSTLKTQPISDEVEDLEMDFDRLYYGGRCELQRTKRSGYDMSNKFHVRAFNKKHAARNQPQAAILRMAGLVSVGDL